MLHVVWLYGSPFIGRQRRKHGGGSESYRDWQTAPNKESNARVCMLCVAFYCVQGCLIGNSYIRTSYLMRGTCCWTWLGLRWPLEETNSLLLLVSSSLLISSWRAGPWGPGQETVELLMQPKHHVSPLPPDPDDSSGGLGHGSQITVPSIGRQAEWLRRKGKVLTVSS